MSKFQEFHDENSSQRSTTHLHAPPSDVEVAGSQAPPPPPGPSPQELAVQKKLKRIQWILTGACVLLWLLIIVILIIYGTRKRCSTVKSIVDDVIIIEGSKSGSLITLILYAQNWLVTEDCYRGWSSTPTSKPLYTIGTIGLYDFDGLTISNYRQLWQRRYDLAFGAIFSFGAVAQEGGWLHFVATTGNALPTLFSYNVASGALQQTAIDALQWGFVTFGTDTSQPYLYYINNDLYGRMVTMNGIDYSQEWAFDDIYLLFPEATGYYNGTQLVANAVSVNGTGQSEVDYEVLPNLTVNQFPTPWARANGSEVISVYFDIQNDMRVLIGPLASSGGRRPGDSCLWWQGGVVTAVSESWAQQVCDGAIFEPVPGEGYSLVDVVNQVEIIIPYLNDWEIVAVTWIAQPAYTAKLWFDPSRGDRKYTTRPYVLTSAATPQGVYLPGYFPEDG